MTFDDGSYYQGEFKKDMMHGRGSIVFPNGNVYVGTFENDKKHGIGTVFDVTTLTKKREEWMRGVRSNFIKTPTTRDELEY